MLRHEPLAIAILTLRLVRSMFASNFSPDTTQEDMSEAPVPLGTYDSVRATFSP